jgi:hypothetical protein
VEICFATLKGVFGMDRTLAKTLTGLATRILRPRSALIPTVSTSSTGSWVGRRDTSRSRGPKIFAILI